MRVINILVVEDEKLIRGGICALVDQFFAKREESYRIFKSNNGRDAYHKCHTGYMDIVITDIKMPVMSGVALTKKILSEQPDLHVLAISGHEDYDYVRDMMKMGAYDYLLKPIDEGQFNKAMEYFVSHLSAAPGPGRTAGLAQNLVEYLLLRCAQHKEEFEAFSLKQGLSQHMACQVVFVKSEPLSSHQGYELYSWVHALGQEFPQVCCLLGEVSVWVLVCIFRGDAPGFAPRLAQVLEEAGQTLLGSQCLPDLDGVYQLHLHWQDGYYDVAPAVAENSQELFALWDGVFLGGADFAQAQKALARLLGFYQSCRTPVPQIQREITGYFYQLMTKEAQYIEFISQMKFTRYDFAEQLQTAGSLSQLQARLQDTLHHLYTLQQKRQADQQDNTVVKAQAYIGKHYARDLQLPDIAGVVHLHPNYFSSLFREKTGVTFREYLRDTRIQAAKALILEGDRPLHEVAEQVGYKDSAHFFRAFKQVTGMTPKTFKNRRG